MSGLTKPIHDVDRVKKLNSYKLLIEREYEDENKTAFKGMISYLKYLYTKGKISDKAYETLVAQALSIFAENAVILKVERVSDRIDESLELASEKLLSNILI